MMQVTQKELRNMAGQPYCEDITHGTQHREDVCDNIPHQCNLSVPVMQTDREGIPFLVVCTMAEEREGYTMMRGTVLHYVERDGDREVHIIPDGGVFDVYFVKGENCSLTYMFGLPNYQPCEDKYYDLDDIFHIAWDNFSIYEEMLDDE